MVLNTEEAMAIWPASGTAQHWPGQTPFVDLAALPQSLLCVCLPIPVFIAC